ncbi:MAG: hypothetical protein JWM21_4505 [Acidobacteria bacterium]|nr:hypothetical protein [Acidobacteriota bacterium]
MEDKQGLNPDPDERRIVGRSGSSRESAGKGASDLLFFTGTEAGTAAARRHFDRIRFGERPPIAEESDRRQREAIVSWWQGDGAARQHLGKLRMPVLVANGFADGVGSF